MWGRCGCGLIGVFKGSKSIFFSRWWFSFRGTRWFDLTTFGIIVKMCLIIVLQLDLWAGLGQVGAEFAQVWAGSAQVWSGPDQVWVGPDQVEVRLGQVAAAVSIAVVIVWLPDVTSDTGRHQLVIAVSTEQSVC